MTRVRRKGVFEMSEYNYINEERNDQDNRIIEGEYRISEPEGGSQKPPKKPKKGLKILCGALAAALVVTACGYGLDYSMKKLIRGYVAEGQTENTEETTEKTTLSTVPTSYSGTSSSTDVSEVVENVAPSIVAIDCTVVQNIEYFGRIYQQEGSGSGSGIIIGQNSEEVLIVTNNHVVSGAKTVDVTFGDGQAVSASVKGTSSNYDLAVVSVKVSEIPEETFDYIKIATLGNSDECKVGEMAIAYGNALGYGQTVTVGYISALNREVAYEDFSMELIQTDAAINPGNSGGALLNARGEVIGINSVKYSSTEIEGIGFAIPISDAIPIITELMNDEAPEESGEAYLGVVPYDVTEEYASRFRMPQGVYVSEVSADSPAEQAGILAGDIITAIQGKEISTTDDLSSALSELTPGDTVAVTLQRIQNGRYVEGTLNVTLGTKTAEVQQ